VNRNVIVVLCVVVGITALLLVGKRASKVPETATAANQGAGQLPSPAVPGSYPRKGSMAPTFELKSIPDGKNVALASLRGKPVLLNFWATWCGPCKIEMPWLVDLQKKYGPEGLQIVGVAMDDTDNKEIADFAHKMGVNYTILLGKESVGQEYGGVNVLPTTFFIDRDGKIVAREFGLQSRSLFVDNIKKALSQGHAVQAQK